MTPLRFVTPVTSMIVCAATAAWMGVAPARAVIVGGIVGIVTWIVLMAAPHLTGTTPLPIVRVLAVQYVASVYMLGLGIFLWYDGGTTLPALAAIVGAAFGLSGAIRGSAKLSRLE